MAKEREDLRQQTYGLLHEIREPSAEEQKEFIDREFVFLLVRPITFRQLIEEDPNYFRSGELDYVNIRTGLRDYATPTAMLVAVNPTELFVPDSFDKNRPTQLVMTQSHSSTHIETVNPDAREVMLPSTALAQLDKAYKKETGHVLFARRWGRSLDNISEVDPANVGRFHHDEPLDIHDWRARGGYPRVGAVSAVVFTGNRK